MPLSVAGAAAARETQWNRERTSRVVRDLQVSAGLRHSVASQGC